MRESSKHRFLFWFASLAALAVLSWIWLSQFQFVYGWQSDDWVVYRKAMSALSNWRNAFLYGQNFLAPYYLTLTYLGLKICGSLNSFWDPIAGTDTGHYRAFLMYFLFYGTFILLSWLVFVRRLGVSPLVTFLGFFGFIFSPGWNLWAPAPETRFMGLPYLLAAMGLWWAAQKKVTRTQVFLGTLAGVLLWYSEAIHYTSLYFLIPFCGSAFLADCFYRRDRHRMVAFWMSLIGAFAAMTGILEFVTVVVVGFPSSQGTIRSMLSHNAGHTTELSFASQMKVWFENMRSQWGLPVMTSALIGSLAFYRERVGKFRLVLVASTWLAFPLIMLKGSKPMLRMTSLQQPVIYFFAAFGIYFLVGRLITRSQRARGIATAALYALILITPLRNTIEVISAQFGFGKAIAFAYEKQRPIAWWTERIMQYRPEPLIKRLPDNALLLTHYPYDLVFYYPGFAAHLWNLAPEFSAPNLWSTEAVHAEVWSFTASDFRNDTLINSARVYEVRKIKKYLDELRPLPIASVRASSFQLGYEPARLFDHDTGPTQYYGWISSKAGGKDRIEIDFATPQTLNEMILVSWVMRAASPIIKGVRVEGVLPDGKTQVLGTYRDIPEAQFQKLTWEKTSVTGLRIQLLSTEFLSAPDKMYARLEEIVFPGYQTELAGRAKSNSALAHLEISRVEPYKEPPLEARQEEFGKFFYPDQEPGNKLVILGFGFGYGSRVYLDGHEIPSRLVYKSTAGGERQMVVILPEGMRSVDSSRLAVSDVELDFNKARNPISK